MLNQPNPIQNGALAPDAPLAALLALRNNPDLKTIDADALRKIVTDLRTMATQEPTKRSKLLKESEELSGSRPKRVRVVSEATKAAAMLD